MRAHGLVPGDRVRLSLENCGEFFELLFGSWGSRDPSELQNVGFAEDSPLEEGGFEPSVPLVSRGADPTGGSQSLGT